MLIGTTSLTESKITRLKVIVNLLRNGNLAVLLSHSSSSSHLSNLVVHSLELRDLHTDLHLLLRLLSSDCWGSTNSRSSSSILEFVFIVFLIIIIILVVIVIIIELISIIVKAIIIFHEVFIIIVEIFIAIEALVIIFIVVLWLLLSSATSSELVGRRLSWCGRLRWSIGICLALLTCGVY